MPAAADIFEWDEQKRRANLAKHGVDFADAARIFDGATIEAPDPSSDDEERVRALGQVDGIVLLVVYAWRGNRRRLIHARKAGKHDQEAYYLTIAGLARSR